MVTQEDYSDASGRPIPSCLDGIVGMICGGPGGKGMGSMEDSANAGQRSLTNKMFNLKLKVKQSSEDDFIFINETQRCRAAFDVSIFRRFQRPFVQH